MDFDTPYKQTDGLIYPRLSFNLVEPLPVDQGSTIIILEEDKQHDKTNIYEADQLLKQIVIFIYLLFTCFFIAFVGSNQCCNKITNIKQCLKLKVW